MMHDAAGISAPSLDFEQPYSLLWLQYPVHLEVYKLRHVFLDGVPHITLVGLLAAAISNMEGVGGKPAWESPSEFLYSPRLNFI